MANHINHRRDDETRKTERIFTRCCAGEGHNGAIGRRVWKTLSRRSERRAGGKRTPKVKKHKGRPVVLINSQKGGEDAT